MTPAAPAPPSTAGGWPVEPPASPFAPSLERALTAARSTGGRRRRWGGARDRDLVAAGGDLSPGTLLAAYRAGLFPMGLGEGGAPPTGWWSPLRRGVLPLEGLHVSRSLARSVRRARTTVDVAFDAVVRACADPSRPGRWITAEIAAAYGALHRAGWAHSVETWAGDELVGGLYGVGIGALFAGESMFSVRTDASKVALVALVDLLGAGDGAGSAVLDVQWRTEHLASLGVVEVPRAAYLSALPAALAAPAPRWPAPLGAGGRPVGPGGMIGW